MVIGILLLFGLLGIYFIYNYRVEKVEETCHEIKPIFEENRQQSLPPLNTINNKRFYNVVRKIRNKRQKDFYLPIGDEVISLEKTGSLLVIGPTGSGKSILLDNIICSILMNYTVNEVKLGIIDTNQVEFEHYKNLSYIIENGSDIELIKRIDREVEIRKQLFKKIHVNDLKEYNKKNRKTPMSKILLIIDDLYDFKDFDFSNMIDSSVGVYLILVTDFQEDKLKISKICFTGIGKFLFKDKEYESIELSNEEIERIVNYHK